MCIRDAQRILRIEKCTKKNMPRSGGIFLRIIEKFNKKICVKEYAHIFLRDEKCTKQNAYIDVSKWENAQRRMHTAKKVYGPKSA